MPQHQGVPAQVSFKNTPTSLFVWKQQPDHWEEEGKVICSEPSSRIPRARETPPPWWEHESRTCHHHPSPQCPWMCSPAGSPAARSWPWGKGKLHVQLCTGTYSEYVEQKYCINVCVLCSFHWWWDTCDRKDVQDSLIAFRRRQRGNSWGKPKK